MTSSESATITIQDFEYDIPGPIRAGTQLSVVNADREAHTVTLEDGLSVVVQGGSSAMLTAPADPGTYEVVCDFHGSMMAELVIT